MITGEARGSVSACASVVLVNMPWARIDAPSIQCGVLQAALRSVGHQATSSYLNLELSAILGPERYEAIMNAPAERVHLLGEWLFGTAAFDAPGNDQSYLREFPEMRDLLPECDWPSLVELRSTRLPEWLDEVADRPEWAGHDLIGFTSTFAQNVAGLALARRLKARLPGATIIFGGANYDDEMGPEYLARLPFIDFVVVGEGDVALPELATAVAERRRPDGIAGVCYRLDHGQVVVQPPQRLVTDMDALPVPEYGGYFDALARLGRRKAVGDRPLRVLVEFSRGCWWGQKHHCTFCGLNALGMPFRAKSPERALRELEHLMAVHKIHVIDAVDNIIDMRYVESFCADLARSGWDADIFFEVKANLTPAQLAALADAGIKRIQPGIESLSSNVLKLMRKGSTMIINVRLLKWARYYGLTVMWNILMGFPGESDADYLHQAELIPSLTHLQPPESCAPLWLERFSPYFRDEEFPISDVKARAAYRLAYPVEGLDHEKIAYFFDYSAAGVASPDAHERLRTAVAGWRAAWESGSAPTLTYRRGPGWIQLVDNRSGTWRKALLQGWQAGAYEAIGDNAHGAKWLHDALVDRGERVTVEQVDAFLGRLVEHRVAVHEDGRFLALAVPASVRPTGPASPAPFTRRLLPMSEPANA